MAVHVTFKGQEMSVPGLPSVQSCASKPLYSAAMEQGGQARKCKREEGHESDPEGTADGDKGPEVGQAKILPQDTCQPA